MSTGESRRDDGGAEEVRDAARRSLSARGARVYRARVREAGAGWTDPWSWEVGVADPAARSIRMRHFYSEDSPVVKLTEASTRWWPWLGGADEPGGSEEDQAESIEIDREHYYGGPDRWLDWSNDESYGPAQVLWALEAILATTAASRAATVELRNDTCTRYLGSVRPGEAAGEPGVKLIDRPQPDDQWRVLDAEVCIDRSGLVRRIAWSPTTGTRLKEGLLPRLAMALHREPEPDALTASKGRLWNVLELWDYGCPVKITRPGNVLTEHPSFREIIGDLWRTRREYRRKSKSTHNAQSTG